MHFDGATFYIHYGSQIPKTKSGVELWTPYIQIERDNTRIQSQKHGKKLQPVCSADNKGE